MAESVLLVVDHEPTTTRFVKELLEEKVDVILFAENGREALEIISTNQSIDCVLCDLNIPGIGGVETIKRVRKKELEIPFIFYTSPSDDKLVKEVSPYGIFGLLNKEKPHNLENIVLRGIKEGMRRQGFNKDSRPNYQKLLSQLKKIDQ